MKPVRVLPAAGALMLLAWPTAAWAHAGHTNAFSQSAGTRGATQLELSAAGQASIGLKSADVKEEDLAAGVITTGRIEADQTRTYVVTPQVAGRVTRLYAELGARVGVGTPLFQVTAPEIGQVQYEQLQAITRAEGDLHTAQTRLALAKANRDRARALFQEGIGAKREAQAAEAEYRQAGTEVATLQSQLALTERTLADRLVAMGMAAGEARRIVSSRHAVEALTIAAPGAGVVLERAVTLGQTVATDTKAFTISDPSRVWVVADVHEQDLAQISKGQAVEIKVTGDPTTYRGVVDYLPTTVDPEKRTAAVRATLPSNGRLRPGMYANLRVVAGTKQHALVVPKSAILTDEAGASVWVKNGDEAFVRQDVQPGATFGDLVEVKGGVAEGDEVVSVGAFQLAAEAVKQGNGPAGHDEHDEHAEGEASGAATPAAPTGTAQGRWWQLGLGGALLLGLGLLAGYLAGRRRG